MEHGVYGVLDNLALLLLGTVVVGIFFLRKKNSGKVTLPLAFFAMSLVPVLVPCILDPATFFLKV